MDARPVLHIQSLHQQGLSVSEIARRAGILFRRSFEYAEVRGSGVNDVYSSVPECFEGPLPECCWIGNVNRRQYRRQVANSGSLAGDAFGHVDTDQRYASELRLVRLTLYAGETKTPRFPLRKNELQFWSSQETWWMFDPPPLTFGYVKIQRPLSMLLSQ